jgi:hypothetical protein
VLLFEQRSQDADIHYVKSSHMRANFRNRKLPKTNKALTESQTSFFPKIKTKNLSHSLTNLFIISIWETANILTQTGLMIASYKCFNHKL